MTILDEIIATQRELVDNARQMAEFTITKPAANAEWRQKLQERTDRLNEMLLSQYIVNLQTQAI